MACSFCQNEANFELLELSCRQDGTNNEIAQYVCGCCQFSVSVAILCVWGV